MNKSQLDEIWTMVDRDYLVRFLEKHPQAIFATISGAHLYGFASPDSDVDLRGAYMLSLKEVLGIRKPRETITVSDESIIDLDWVAHDIRKFASMMVRHNGYVLEQLFSPVVVVTSPAHEELIELGKGCVTRPLVRHYLGFARGRKKRMGEPNPTVKHLLYAYRVLLTGIHAMETGEILANIIDLNERFRIEAINELVDRKRSGNEFMALRLHDHAVHAPLLDHLEQRLHEAYEESELPMEPTTKEAINDFVVRIRLESAE